jgi:putative hydroxymethylpyrimidine transport system substrate-binding protein
MRSICAVTALVAILLAIGCGGGGETQPGMERTRHERSAPSQPTRTISITLDAFEGAENVAILMAKERGYFVDAGLDVHIYTSPIVHAPILYVAQRIVQISVSHEPQLALARDRGAPVIAVGSLLSEPTSALIWLKRSRIEGIQGLRGKTVGIPGLSFQTEFLRQILAQAGLKQDEVKIRPLGHELVPRLIHGDVDAIFGSSNLEGAFLEARGLQPVVVPVQSLGIPSYDELVVIARPDWARKHRRIVRNFMSAVARGAAAAAADLEVTTAVSEAGPRTDPHLDYQESEAAMKATMPLLSSDARLNPGQAGRLIAWMHEMGLIDSRLPVAALISNRYLKPAS